MEGHDPNVIESLLNHDESITLDFKERQYLFVKASDEEKSELLKDILAFANAHRESDAYILIGVKEVKGGRSIPVGLDRDIDDASLQQFVNGKVNVTIEFSYFVVEVDDKRIGVIHIPIQKQRPIYLKKKYQGIDKEEVIIRRGSSTGTATLEEIARMGTISEGGPELDLLFPDKSKTLSCSVPPADIKGPEEVERLFGEFQAKYPMASIDILDKMVPYSDLLTSLLGDDALSDIREAAQLQAEYYNKWLSEKYHEYRRYLEDLIEYNNYRCAMLEIAVSIVNTGTAPAREVSLRMHFPDGMDVVKASSLPVKPIAPEPPEHFDVDKDYTGILIREYFSRGQSLSDIDFSVLYESKLGANDKGGELHIRKTNSYEITMDIERIMHHKGFEIEPLAVMFDSDETVRDFTIDYTMWIGNRSKPVQGKLYVHPLVQQKDAEI